MDKKTKLKKVLKALTTPDDLASDAFSSFDKSVEGFKSTLSRDLYTPVINSLGSQIKNYKTETDNSIKGILKSVNDYRVIFQRESQNLNSLVQGNNAEFSKAVKEFNSEAEKKINKLKSDLEKEISKLGEDSDSKFSEIIDAVSALDNSITEVKTNNRESSSKTDSNLDSLKKEFSSATKVLNEALDELRSDLLGKIAAAAQSRGGAMNRQILVGGNDPLTTYTDINLKAGNNVTLTYANNNTTKKVDLTITATGGGGMTRSINTISTDTSAGSTAGTDYVYICSAALTLTMPATVGNQNLYTIKNTSVNGTITIVPSGSDTIDTDINLLLPVRFTSVDLISNGVDGWEIT